MRKSIHLLAVLCLIGPGVAAQEGQSVLSLELNAEADADSGCLLTFMVSNAHAQDIDSAVFETVLFDTEGRVDRLTLFDFGTLPANRPRVRQFQLDGLTCDALGQVLINGASTCKVGGADSPLCAGSLKLRSRTDTELTG